MKVLLSIKPQFADKIFDGSKRFEFRRTIFKNPNVKVVLVYASSPVQRIIGEFEIEKILVDTPSSVWEKTKKYSGITKEFFFEYFTDKQVAYAIKIKKTKRYKTSYCIKERYNITPPQSFIYI